MFRPILALRGFGLDFLVSNPLSYAVNLNGDIIVSLRAFHVFFIFVSVALALFFGIWCIKQGGVIQLISAFISFALGVGLTVYLFVFIKKVRELPDSGDTF